jgi:MFS transporter, DHA2 family, multidrug resistance protein
MEPAASRATPGGRAVAAAVLLPTTLAGLSPFVCSVSLDHIAGALSVAPDELTWAVTAHIVAYSVMLPISTWLSPLLGRRRLFLLSIATFTAASAAAGAATSLPVLIFARVVQGLAGGSLVPISQIIMMDVFPGRRRSFGLALWSLAVASGSIIGPALGGLITEAFGWRWLFHFKVPVGLTALWLARLTIDRLPEHDRRGVFRRGDLAALGLLVVGIGALQAMLQRGQREDWWDSPVIVGLALVSGASLVLFVAQQLRTRPPVMDLAIFRNPTFAVGCLVTAVMGWCQSCTVVLSAVFSTRIMDHGPLRAGLVLAPAGLGTAVISLLAGKINTRLDPRFLSVLGAVGAAAGMFQLAGLTPEATFTQLMWPRLMVGFGLGCLLGSLTAATLATLTQDEVQRAAGPFNLIRNLGGCVGIAVMGNSLETGTQIHRSGLVQKMEPYLSDTTPVYQPLLTELARRGADASSAAQQALETLSAIVRKQALFLSFIDSYQLLAALLVLSIPLLLFMRRARGVPRLADRAGQAA